MGTAHVVEVCHVRHRKGREGYYIGRPSDLGNPFVIGRDGTRAEVIAKYSSWLHDKLQRDWLRTAAGRAMLELLKAHTAGQDVRLYCYCAPEPCHGDVVKQLLEQTAREARSIEVAKAHMRGNV
jgi:hypothetical protein